VWLSKNFSFYFGCYCNFVAFFQLDNVKNNVTQTQNTQKLLKQQYCIKKKYLFSINTENCTTNIALLSISPYKKYHKENITWLMLT